MMLAVQDSDYHSEFYLLFKKLFIYLAASGLRCSMQGLCPLMWDLYLQRSVAAVFGYGFSCPGACGIVVSRDLIPCTARHVLNHWTTREVSPFLILLYVFNFLFCLEV